MNPSLKKDKDKVIDRTRFERRLYHANNGLLRAKSTSARSTARQVSSSGVSSSRTNRARIARQYQDLELRSPEIVNFATRTRVQRIYLSTTASQGGFIDQPDSSGASWKHIQAAKEPISQLFNNWTFLKMKSHSKKTC